MKKLFSSALVFTLVLSSCSHAPELSIQKPYKTFLVKNGSLTINDALIASVEGGTTTDLAFKTSGRVSAVNVHPGEKVKKGQVLATLNNQEGSIQVGALGTIEEKLQDLGNSTNAIKINTENLQKATKTLYTKRLESMNVNIETLKNTLEKARQNLANQKTTLAASFSTFAHDYDRLTSNMLYEGDKILGITTNFEYTNDGWESYLGARVGNARADAENKWNVLYTNRGQIRAYTDSGATISDINTALKDLTDAYIHARLYGVSMNFMLQNSVVGGGLSEEKLNGWTSLWLGLTGNTQQSETSFINWKNSVLNLTNTNGSGTVADKDVASLELELRNLEISRDTLLAEGDAKIKEIQANVATAQTQNGQVSVQIAQTQMSKFLAQESIDYNFLVAPFDGVILEKSIEPGTVVGAGVPTMTLSSLDKTLLKVYIDNDVYKYKVGDEILLTNPSSYKTLTGAISLLQAEKDPLHNKNYTEILIKTSGQILGERLVVSLSRKKSPLQNGVIIPLASIITRYGTPGVFEVVDGRAQFTLVNIILSDLSFAEVFGIKEGTVIITAGKENIIDGQELDESPPKTDSHLPNSLSQGH